MESSPDLSEQVLGMVRATITRVVGPDALQASQPSVRVHGEGAPTPTLEIGLRYGDRVGSRRLVLPPESDVLALERTVNDALLPMLTEMGLLPAAATAVDNPPLGGRPADQV
jgi:hypothetical protein